MDSPVRNPPRFEPIKFEIDYVLYINRYAFRDTFVMHGLEKLIFTGSDTDYCARAIEQDASAT